MTELLLSFYGDDLTGSTDAMEALESRGVATTLFIHEPTSAQRDRFAGVRAIGLAGTSRSEAPEWMDEHLTPSLAWLKSLGAAICHYKVCSTFDSSPRIGSIGRAIDIGRVLFQQACVPLIVGAPQLKRYTAFGNLFAAYEGRTYRIDRHPVMSRHPVTPMHEADLRLHLVRQSNATVGLCDLGMMQSLNADEIAEASFNSGDGIVMLDVADIVTQLAAGRQVWRWRKAGCAFVAGSSGVEYALLAEWERLGLVPGPINFALPGPVDRMAVVSGSCSPTTERQIRFAQSNGFEAIALDPQRLASAEDAVINEAVEVGLESLNAGRSVILYTALGPSTDIGSSLDGVGARHAIGRGLGRIERALVAEAKLKRAVIAGGDTSSHALQQLDIFALTTLLPLPATPGSPLCLAHSDTPAFDGLQIALKGGQVGGDDYFCKIRDGVG
jgi:uncharacterized protein YgbK (DUF1537 family)